MLRKFDFGMMTAVIASAFCFSVSSCKDDEYRNDDTYLPGNFHYQLNVPNTNEEMTVVLDSISSPVKSIDSSPDWATVAAVDSMVNGHPVLHFVLRQSDANTKNSGEVVVTSEKDDRVTLTLNQAFLWDDNVRLDDEFCTDWENMESVMIYSDKTHQKVNLPWADNVMTTLPSTIRSDVKKKDGWEMAFSVLNNESLDDCNYFALYNRYLGTLRVFHFVTNATTTASKYSFEVNMGSSGTKNKYPFYHSLAYAIPNSHTSVSNTMNMLDDDVSSSLTFKSFFSPYTSMSSTALTKGWTAFDIDVSSYCPSNNSWITSGDEMSIFCKTELEQSVSLEGALSANISGKYSSAEQTASASSGISSLLSQASSLIGDIQNSALAAIEEQLTGSSFNRYCRYIGNACSVAAYAYDYLIDNPYAEHVVDSMPGKIEMSMTGKISLSGYITSLASNSVAPLTMRVSNFAKYNSHLGQGVWNLAEDPVVYVVDDRMMGDLRRINLTVNGDGTYGNSDLDDYHLRMVSFFDPTSVKLNINTDVFPDISDVKVICDYGVYTDAVSGHTSKYAKLMELERPKMQIVKSDETMSIYKSTNTTNKTRYMMLPHTQFMSSQLEETKENCSVVWQPGSNYFYYGRAEESEGKTFMISPQVYFPFAAVGNNTTLYDGEMPDFVVLVNVSFKSAGRTFVFSNRFLPKIVPISSAGLKAKYDELQSYADKCKADQAVNYLQNNNSVGVKHTKGDGSVQKTLDILNAVINYQF